MQRAIEVRESALCGTFCSPLLKSRYVACSSIDIGEMLLLFALRVVKRRALHPRTKTVLVSRRGMEAGFLESFLHTRATTSRERAVRPIFPSLFTAWSVEGSNDIYIALSTGAHGVLERAPWTTSRNLEKNAKDPRFEDQHGMPCRIKS